MSAEEPVDVWLPRLAAAAFLSAGYAAYSSGAVSAPKRVVELVNRFGNAIAERVQKLVEERDQLRAALKEWASSCADCGGTGKKIVSGESCEEPCLSTRKLLGR